MSLPLLPDAQRTDVNGPTTTPLTAGDVAALVTALEPVAPRAAAAARRAITAPPQSSTAITVLVSIDSHLPAEGYTLALTPTLWEITAADENGAFYAVITLAQILRDGNIPIVTLSDAPTYPVRGFMLDIARVFFTPAEIKRIINIAAAYKLNQLHLHLTDDQGWRIEIDNLPLLTTVAADHDMAGGHGGFLSIEDYVDLQQYAAERHIVIIPEIDLPGHSHAAQIAYPEISPDGKVREPYVGMKVGFSSLHLTSAEAWAWVDQVVASMAAHTLGEYIHLGGDEPLTLSREDYLIYMTRLAKVAKKHGKKVTFWQEAAGADLPPQTRLQYWTRHVEISHLARIAREQDVQFIASPGHHAYLDMKYDENFALGQDWAGLIDLKQAYDWDPVAALPNIPAESIIGVEACLWSETMRSFDDVITMLLPRLPAIASVAWGSPKDFHAFSDSLSQHGQWWTEAGLAFHRSEQISWR